MGEKETEKPSDAIKHDAFLKKAFESPVATREFLDEFLSDKVKQKLDLTKIIVEKESYVEEDLTRRISDIVLSVKTKSNDDAFVYVLIENQSNPDYWIAFRLWKYMLLLSERHKKKRNKLPLVCPIVLYNGKKKYTAPLNLWELFEDPELAKELWINDYNLVDLRAMQDDEINYDKHVSMFVYMLKHIHDRDLVKSIEQLLENCRKVIQFDVSEEYIYMKSIMWYCGNRLERSSVKQINCKILDIVPEENRNDIMKTFAQECTEKGIAIGIEQGLEQGFQQGKFTIARALLQDGMPASKVANVTNIPVSKIVQLKDNIPA